MRNRETEKGKSKRPKYSSLSGPFSVRLTIFMSLVQRERRVRYDLLLEAPPQTKGVSAYLGIRLQGPKGGIYRDMRSHKGTPR